MSEGRVIAWFSCGIPSAVASKVSLQLFGSRCQVVTCDTRPSENSDNYRFSREVEQWLGVPITYIRNDKYKDVDEVFEKTRYMSGITGARCTTELKKIPRLEFALPDDVHVFGYHYGEQLRAQEFAKRNPDLICETALSRSVCAAL